MKISKTLMGASLLAIALATAACNKPGDAKDEAAVAQMTPEAAKTALHQLFTDSDENDLKLSPISALFRGDMRYAGEFGDYISDDFLAKLKANKEGELKRLNAIDRAKLSATDQIAYDVFRWQTENALDSFKNGIMAIGVQMPVDHFNGMHTFFPDLSSGQSAAPYKTVADYENGLKRIDGFVTFFDSAIERMKQGMKAGHVQPKLVMENVIGQLDTQLAIKTEDSPYYMPIKNWPADFSAADKKRLTEAYKAAINDKIYPAYKRMRDFIAKDYLPACRDGKPGLVSMKDGAKVYADAIATYTTTNKSADEIHNLGLSEVERITKGMEAIKQKVGFKGDLHAFFEFIRTDPQFKPKSKEDLLGRYTDIQKRVEANIGKLFSLTPKTPFQIRPVPDYMEKNAAAGSYQQGSPDGKRPGTFFANTYDLPSRLTHGMETLFLHEAEPGHHFQISLAQENAALPNFMRFGGNTAYVEGWALYAESLAHELGMETDPYQELGGYDDEMLRAMRLVVDTGIHSKGWTRDQAIQYMLDHSAMSKTEVVAEVERYIAMPGQALAYKIGALTIRKLRTEAEKELGPKFDIKAFHAQVLDTGALPMSVLEAKIHAWIKAEKAKG